MSNSIKNTLAFNATSGGFTLPTSAQNIIEFDAQMDESLPLEILLLLKNIQQVSPNCAGCTLKKTQQPWNWIIAFTWRDATSMQRHFSSRALQILLKLLVPRCSRLPFGDTSTTVA